MSLFYVAAISVKDEKNTGNGFAKIVPVMKNDFWGKEVPGVRFNKAKFAPVLVGNGIYDLDIKTENVFSFPQHEIIKAKLIYGIDSLIADEPTGVRIR